MLKCSIHYFGLIKSISAAGSVSWSRSDTSRPVHFVRPSQGFSPHRSAEQTALMRTQIPSCYIDLQTEHWRGEINAACTLPLPTGPLETGIKRAEGSAYGPCSRGKGLITITFCVSLITSLFPLTGPLHLQGRSYNCFSQPSCPYNV